MKKIVGGRVYNTETADLVGTYNSGHPAGDFSKEITSLYKTKKGGWFLSGHGGALSRWGQQVPGDRARINGAGLEVLTEREAMAWAEEHLESDEVEEAFASMLQEA